MSVKSGSGRVRFEMTGLDVLANRLADMGNKGNRIANDALRKAAEPIAEDARRRAPVRSGTLRKHIEVLPVKTKDGQKLIEVGIKNAANGPAFYGRFIEYGAKGVSAQPFLEPAFLANKGEAEEVLMTEIKKALGLQ